MIGRALRQILPGVSVVALCGFFFLSPPAWSQVSAETVDPQPEETNDDDIIMESPLRITVSLGATDTRRSIKDLEERRSWYSGETNRYVVDRCRVKSVMLMKTKVKKKRIDLEATVRLTSEWFRQDINLMLELIDEGETLFSERWDGYTIGNDSPVVFGGRSRAPVAEWRTTPEELESWFDDEAPQLRVTVEVLDDDDDDDEER